MKNDTVSRQAAIDSISADIMGGLNYESILKKLPSADRPKGEWVFDTQIPISGGGSSAGYRCSICGRDYFRVDGMNFCGNCGARMKGADDEND